MRLFFLARRSELAVSLNRWGPYGNSKEGCRLNCTVPKCCYATPSLSGCLILRCPEGYGLSSASGFDWKSGGSSICALLSFRKQFSRALLVANLRIISLALPNDFELPGFFVRKEKLVDLI
jgi:hypothetical protein